MKIVDYRQNTYKLLPAVIFDTNSNRPARRRNHVDKHRPTPTLEPLPYGKRGKQMDDGRRNMIAGLVAAAIPATAIAKDSASAQPLEFIHPGGLQKGSAAPPYSPAVKVGNLVFVSGTPAFNTDGKLAVGNFTAQMMQVMANITNILAAAGTNWSRVVKTNVCLTRREDFAEMNRIYASHFPDGKYPARTTLIVYSLPSPDFLLEIECMAILE
ncbi:RidA family protein [Paraherbaspirillum soli]|uniref:RidA family protein n=1 Tax=Paraherbaspirillum soli TaxID=631222 RepID=A0ABW0ME81_9BURK